MKNVIISIGLFALLLVGSMACAQKESTTFYLVRHAEKMKDGTNDPPLTKQGITRAKKLTEILEEVELAAIYSSPYKRTQQTARPTAEQKNIEITPYNPSKQVQFAESLMSDTKGKKVLIVGHSNTIPMLVNILLNSEDYSQLDDEEYGKLFIVTIDEQGKASARVEDY